MIIAHRFIGGIGIKTSMQSAKRTAERRVRTRSGTSATGQRATNENVSSCRRPELPLLR